MEEEHAEHAEAIQVGRRRSSLGALSKSKPVSKLKSMFEAKGAVPKLKDNSLFGKLKPVSASHDASSFAAAMDVPFATSAHHTISIPAPSDQHLATPTQPVFPTLQTPDQDVAQSASSPLSAEDSARTPPYNETLQDGSETDAKSAKSPTSGSLFKRMGSSIKKALTPRSAGGKQKQNSISPGYAGSDAGNLSPRPSSQLPLTLSSQTSSTSLDLNCRSDQLQHLQARSPTASLGYGIANCREDIENAGESYAEGGVGVQPSRQPTTHSRPPLSPRPSPSPSSSILDGLASRKLASSSPYAQSPVLDGITSTSGVGASTLPVENLMDVEMFSTADAVEDSTPTGDVVDGVAASLTTSPTVPNETSSIPVMREVNMGADIVTLSTALPAPPGLDAVSSGEDVAASDQGNELVFPSLPVQSSISPPELTKAVMVAGDTSSSPTRLAEPSPSIAVPTTERAAVFGGHADLDMEVVPPKEQLVEVASGGPLSSAVSADNAAVVANMAAAGMDIDMGDAFALAEAPSAAPSFAAEPSDRCELSTPDADVSGAGADDADLGSPKATMPAAIGDSEMFIAGLTPIRPDIEAFMAMQRGAPGVALSSTAAVDEDAHAAGANQQQQGAEVASSAPVTTVPQLAAAAVEGGLSAPRESLELNPAPPCDDGAQAPPVSCSNAQAVQTAADEMDWDEAINASAPVTTASAVDAEAADSEQQLHVPSFPSPSSTSSTASPEPGSDATGGIGEAKTDAESPVVTKAARHEPVWRASNAVFAIDPEPVTPASSAASEMELDEPTDPQDYSVPAVLVAPDAVVAAVELASAEYPPEAVQQQEVPLPVEPVQQQEVPVAIIDHEKSVTAMDTTAEALPAAVSSFEPSSADIVLAEAPGSELLEPIASESVSAATPADGVCNEVQPPESVAAAAEMEPREVATDFAPTETVLADAAPTEAVAAAAELPQMISVEAEMVSATAPVEMALVEVEQIEAMAVDEVPQVDGTLTNAAPANVAVAEVAASIEAVPIIMTPGDLTPVAMAAEVAQPVDEMAAPAEVAPEAALSTEAALSDVAQTTPFLPTAGMALEEAALVEVVAAEAERVLVVTEDATLVDVSPTEAPPAKTATAGLGVSEAPLPTAEAGPAQVASEQIESAFTGAALKDEEALEMASALVETVMQTSAVVLATMELAQEEFAAVEAAPIEPVSLVVAEVEPAPENLAQIELASAEAAEAEPVTAEAIPLETASAELAAVEATPEEPVPTESAVLEVAAVETVPKEPTAMETASPGVAAVEVAPVGTAAIEPALEVMALEAAPVEAPIIGTTSSDVALVEAAPNEPVETAPVEPVMGALEAAPEEPAAIQPVAPEVAAVEAVPEEPATMDTAPPEEAAVEPMPEGPATMDTASPEVAAVEPVPEEPATMDTAPPEEAAVEAVPEEPATMDTAPPEVAAVDAVLEEPATMDTAPPEEAAVDAVPEEPATMDTAPPEVAAVEAAPEEPATMDTAPPEVAAVEPVPEELATMDTATPEVAAIEAVPVEPATMDTATPEVAAVEAAPVQPAVSDTASPQVPAVEAAPAESIEMAPIGLDSSDMAAVDTAAEEPAETAHVDLAFSGVAAAFAAAGEMVAVEPAPIEAVLAVPATSVEPVSTEVDGSGSMPSIDDTDMEDVDACDITPPPVTESPCCPVAVPSESLNEVDEAVVPVMSDAPLSAEGSIELSDPAATAEASTSNDAAGVTTAGEAIEPPQPSGVYPASEVEPLASPLLPQMATEPEAAGLASQVQPPESHSMDAQLTGTFDMDMMEADSFVAAELCTQLPACLPSFAEDSPSVTEDEQQQEEHNSQLRSSVDGDNATPAAAVGSAVVQQQPNSDPCHDIAESKAQLQDVASTAWANAAIAACMADSESQQLEQQQVEPEYDLVALGSVASGLSRCVEAAVSAVSEQPSSVPISAPLQEELEATYAAPLLGFEDTMAVDATVPPMPSPPRPAAAEAEDPMMVSPAPVRVNQLAPLSPDILDDGGENLQNPPLNSTSTPGNPSSEIACLRVRAFQLSDVAETDFPTEQQAVVETPAEAMPALEDFGSCSSSAEPPAAQAETSAPAVAAEDEFVAEPESSGGMAVADVRTCGLQSSTSPRGKVCPVSLTAASAAPDSLEAIEALWGNDDLLAEGGDDEGGFGLPLPLPQEASSPVGAKSPEAANAVSTTGHKVAPDVVLQVQRESLDLFSLRNSCAGRVSDSLMVESLDSFERAGMCAKGRAVPFVPMAPLSEAMEQDADDVLPAAAMSGSPSPDLTFATGSPTSEGVPTPGLTPLGPAVATTTASKPSPGGSSRLARPGVSAASKTTPPSAAARANTTPSTALKAMAAASGAGKAVPKRSTPLASKPAVTPGALLAGVSAAPGGRLVASGVTPGGAASRAPHAAAAATSKAPGIFTTPRAVSGTRIAFTPPSLTPPSMFGNGAGRMGALGQQPPAVVAGRTGAAASLFDTPMVLRAAAVPLDSPFSGTDFDLDTVDISAEASRAIAMLGANDAAAADTPVLVVGGRGAAGRIAGTPVPGTPTMSVLETHVQLLTSKLVDTEAKLAEAENKYNQSQEDISMLRDQLSTLQFERSMTNDLDMEREARQFVEQELAVLRHRFDGVEAELRAAHAEIKRRDQAIAEAEAASQAKEASMARVQAELELRMQQMQADLEAARAFAQQADARAAQAEGQTAALKASCDEEAARCRELQSTLGLQAHQLVQVQRARDETEAKFQKAMEQLIAAQTSHKKQVGEYEQKIQQQNVMMTQLVEYRDRYRQMKQHVVDSDLRQQEATNALAMAQAEKTELMRMCNELLTQLEATKAKGPR